jgi:phosphoglycolate phosphatase-like HAD superfamily hydrolase
MALGRRRADHHDRVVQAPEPLLVLWDMDQTLIEIGSSTREAYAAAFLRASGRPLSQPWRFNGRTELAAATEVLHAHGVQPAPATLDAFLSLIVEELHARTDDMRRAGRVLPGAREALIACAARPGVHQSVLTGNLRQLAELKADVFGLSPYLDLRIGAFGGDAFDRTDLPPHAWARAAEHLGHRFSGADTVIIGDTVLDVATGRAAGARVIAVATGPADEQALGAAGADVVFSDLTETGAVLDAITGRRS